MTLQTLVGLPIREMTEDETQWFLQLSLIDTKGIKPLLTIDEANDIGPAGRMLHARLDLSGAQVSAPLGAFICALSGGRPAILVMWAYTLTQMWCRRRQAINVEDWACDFGEGVPTEIAYQQMWAAQKSEDGIYNLLDKGESWTVNSQQSS